MSRTSSRAIPVGPKAATFREIIRRLDAIERRLNHGGTRAVPESDFARQFEIIEEERLRRQVARQSLLRQENPILWRKLEMDRRARNREKAVLNRRLRAEGLHPVELEPSLAQRMKKLQQIDARESTRTATRTTRR
jgi:hypothetical protein